MDAVIKKRITLLELVIFGYTFYNGSIMKCWKFIAQKHLLKT